jgi:hypothetical protein
LANFLSSLMRRANDPTCCWEFRLAGEHAFQQSAFKVTAMLRTQRVNLTLTILEGSAWLRKDGVGRTYAEWQTARLQSTRIIAALQLHVGKDHAVATHAAGEAKLFGDGRFVAHVETRAL